jgi:hypothetical protein
MIRNARLGNDRAAYIQGKDYFVKRLVQRAIARSPLSPTSRGSLDLTQTNDSMNGFDFNGCAA